nr:hypothetical protein [Tanacetum cinerariifolium]
MVADLRYFNSLESEVDSLTSQLETQKTQFVNEIDCLFREYYYADHMNAILSVYTEFDEVTNLQCDILELLQKCECLEKELSNIKRMSKSFESVQKHAINLELELQKCKEKDLKAQLQDKGIAIRVILTTSVSILQLKSNPQGDRVLRSNSREKKLEVEEHRRNVKLSKNKTSITACNDSLNAKTVNVKSVFAMYAKCVMIDKHDLCVPKSIAKPLKKTVSSESIKKPRNNLIEIVLFIIDSRCSKHMTGNLKLLINFMEKFLGTVKFRNDQIAPILGYGDLNDQIAPILSYGDLVQGVVTIKRVYYVEGLNHNLFSVGQFCYANLEVAFRKSTCYIRDLKVNDLLTGSRGIDLYLITLQDINCPNPICLMTKAKLSQAWLWHRRLSHLNFDAINLLSKDDIVVGLPKLKFVKDHLCSSCELGKAKRKSFYTKITQSSKSQLQLLHMDLCGPMRVASINGKRYVLVIVDDYSRYTWTHFLRSKDETPKTLYSYFDAEGILHQTSVARTPEQNGVVERRNRTLVEAARTMLSAAKRWGNLDKMKEKGDECIFMGYSTQSRAYRVFNKRTRVIMESIHFNFNEMPQMASVHNSSDPAPTCQTMASVQISSDPAPECTTSNEVDLLFSPMFDELLNGSSKVVSKSSAVSAADAPNQRQQLTTPLNNHTTPAPTCQTSPITPTVISSENINQAEPYAENDQVADNEFINIFSTPVQEQGETSSRHVDSSNMHTFYQRYPSEHRWTKDHPLEQVIGNPSQSVRTRRQLESDPEMCMFALTVSRTEPKNIKEVMADSAWIESMQEELHQFDRLDVWELVDRPL